MGLSASQARLLSITSRLSDNELRSQTITNAKSALSTKTSQASAEYLAALDETNMYFSNYDVNGNKVQTALTGACLAEYAPLKNQYAIVNPDGQAMVSEIDAQNYLESGTLGEFLEKYGVATVEDVPVDNPKYVEQAIYLYGSDWESYLAGSEDYTAGGLMAIEPRQEDYNMVEWTETTNNELYPKFREASKKCYDRATSGNPGCYIHVLAHLLDLELNDSGNAESPAYPKHYETTYGQNITVNALIINGSYIHSDNKSIDMVEISDAVCNGSPDGKTYYAAEDEADKANYEDLPNQDLTANELLTQQLLSNYYTDANGETQLKTLKQKVIDLYYIVDNYHNHGNSLGVDYDTTLLDALKRFQKDMELSEETPSWVPDVPAWEAAHAEWLQKLQAGEAVLNGLDRYVIDDQIDITDADQATWYINLWHRMNGASNYKVEIDGVENGTKPSQHYLGQDEEEDRYAGVYNNLVEGVTKNGKLLWTVWEDGLMNSADYLNHAIKNNLVTIERVNFTEPTVDGSGLEQATWTSIIYTNALDISETENEKAITVAEVKYKQTLSDIEAQDKQYDNMIRRLDTEHSALQTEYDSIKSVITKNIERTLKMYS